MPVDIASGSVNLTYTDAEVAGAVALAFERIYDSQLLLRPPTALGLGWTSSLYTTLEIGEDRLTMRRGATNTEFVVNPADVWNRGLRALNAAAFSEIFRRDDELVVQQWNVESSAVWRYAFRPSDDPTRIRLSSIEDTTGQGVDLLWRQGRLIAARQRAEQRQLEFDHAANGLLTAVYCRAANGQRRSMARYDYDDESRLVAVYDALDNVSGYRYDLSHRLILESTKDGGQFTFRYDIEGRCVHTAGSAGYDEKRLTYLPSVNCTEVTNSLGSKAIYQYNGAGQVLTETDPLGGRRHYRFDEHGRLIAKVDANGAAFHYAYDEVGNRVRVRDSLGAEFLFSFTSDHRIATMRAPTGHVWQRWYDTFNRMVRSRDPTGGEWHIVYGADGFPVSVSDPRGNARKIEYKQGTPHILQDREGHRHVLEFDDYGRLSQYITPLGRDITYAYDALDNVLAIKLPDDSVSRFEYDGAGNVTRYTDAAGYSVRYRYGPCRRLVEKEDRTGGVVTYAWTTEPGQLHSITNEIGETFSFEWDAAGRLSATESFDGIRRSFAFNAAGQVVSVTNGAGETQRVLNDPMGKPIEISLETGERQHYAYDLLGNIIEARTEAHAVRLERDALGRIVKEWQDDQWVETRYDGVGNPIGITTSLDSNLGFQFDGNNALSAASYNGRAIAAIARDADGREVRRELGNGLLLLQTFGRRGLLQTQRLGNSHADAGNATGDLLSRYYTHDERGLLQSLTDQDFGTTRFDYDPAERLIAASKVHLTEDWSFDPCGNIRHIRRSQGDAHTEARREYGLGNRLLVDGGTRLAYDGDGRLVEKTEGHGSAAPRTWRYAWDGWGRLRSLVTPEGRHWAYSYDAFGRRLQKAGPDRLIRYVWNQNSLLHERSARPGGDAPAWATVSTLIHEPRSPRPLAQVQNGKVQAVITDRNGLPTEIVDEGGALFRIDRDHWGRRADAPARVRYLFGFEGQLFDEESGLYYSRFRYYDPGTARFISQDPKGILGGLNLYLYCPNPFNDTDPFGLDSAKLDRALGGEVGDGKQAHHIVPEQVMKQNPDLMTAVTPLGFQPDGAANGILLHSDDAKARAESMPSHRGSHPEYNRQVGADVAAINQRLANGDITPDQALKELNEVQSKWREKIENNDDDLPRGKTSDCKLG